MVDRLSKGFPSGAARPYVVERLLPQVLAHLPAGKSAVGAVVRMTADGPVTLPLTCEHLVDRGFRSCRPYYVLWSEGEPAEYLSPALFRRLVRAHRAFVVLEGQDRRDDLADRRRPTRGAFAIRRVAS